MITIKNKINNREIDRINNNDYFSIDKDFIYIKDEFGSIIKFSRKMFYSEMDLNLNKLKEVLK